MRHGLSSAIGTESSDHTKDFAVFNPLPTNDAHMRHGLSISQQEFIWGFSSRHYNGFCFFYLFLMVGEGLRVGTN